MAQTGWCWSMKQKVPSEHLIDGVSVFEWQFDVALSRNFRFKEAQRVEVRAEAFNLTNSFRMDNLNSNSTSNTFGQVTSARDPRIMKFALKYFF